jgi:hypothetical protein
MLSVLALVVSGITSYGQVTEAEVPGDNFSLEGALELFKKSKSPEEFERLLNSADSKVNNLDLNGDGYIDYIRVHDRYKGDVHAFTIQAVISERETQDIAVIELEKKNNGEAVLQIIGDEDIYGVTTIIEPTREVRTYAGSSYSPTVVNVWTWPSVRYVYSPYYTAWSSPWGWHHHPRWYRTWRPVSYVHYYPIWRPYYSYYVPCHTRRVAYAYNIYHPYRTTSVYVRNRHHDQITRYRSESRHDSRNGRTRNDDRYTNSNRNSNVDTNQRRREDSDLSRRTSPQREAFSSDRSSTGIRTIPADRSRNTSEIKRNTEIKRDAVPVRRTETNVTNRDVRPEVTRPTTNRSRPSVTPEVQQRTITRERPAPVEMQRQSSEASMRRSPSLQTNRESRPQVTAPTVNRSRPSVTPQVQQQRSISRERSAPSVQQGSSHRSEAATRSIERKRGRE